MRSVYGPQGRERFAMNFEHYLWEALTVDLRVECISSHDEVRDEGFGSTNPSC
jgi:hypothetical protein